MLRKLLVLALITGALISLEGCARRLSKTVESLQTTASELKSRADALEARLQNVENVLAQEHDVATRVVGKWSGISIQSDSNGKFREAAGQSLTFGSDGSVSQVHLTGLAGAVGYRALNANALVFSFPGGRLQVATNVEMQGNRLSFLVGSAPSTAVTLTRQ